MRLLEKKIQEEVSLLADQLCSKLYSFAVVRPVPDDVGLEKRFFVGHGFIGTANIHAFLYPDLETLELHLSYSGSPNVDPDAIIKFDFPLSEELLQELQSVIKK